MKRTAFILVHFLIASCAAQASPAGPDAPVAAETMSAESAGVREPRRLVPVYDGARVEDPGTSQAPGEASESSTLSVLIPLVTVIALILSAAWVVRRLARGSGSLSASLGAGGRSPAGVLEVLGRYPIGRGATLVLLRLDKRVLLLSQHAGVRGSAGMATLAEVSDPEEVASLLLKTREQEGESLAARFQSILARGSAKEAPDVIDVTDEPQRDRGVQTQASRLVGVRA